MQLRYKAELSTFYRWSNSLRPRFASSSGVKMVIDSTCGIIWRLVNLYVGTIAEASFPGADCTDPGLGTKETAR